MRTIRFGLIGAGLMGREFASAAARWCHLLDLDFCPEIVAVCDTQPAALDWFRRHVPTVELVTGDYRELAACDKVEAVYCAIPHHLHAEVYTAIIEAGKHLLGEKPFGIDREANDRILKALARRPDLLVRCSSEFPFFPGAQRVIAAIREERFGRIIEVEAGFWHSSDLNPYKPINWKRRRETNGEYGCMGDLGMHVVHIPFRFGWVPATVYAQLSSIVAERPDGRGGTAPCDTWDNAVLSCVVENDGESFPMTLSTKRIAPGHTNTWFIRIIGTEFSIEYSTADPKSLWSMAYKPGEAQAWRREWLGHETAYPTITGSIFEFGFSDAILQMWAAFCDELVNGERMAQGFRCATPEETAASHALFTAALRSHARRSVEVVEWPRRPDRGEGA